MRGRESGRKRRWEGERGEREGATWLLLCAACSYSGSPPLRATRSRPGSGSGRSPASLGGAGRPEAPICRCNRSFPLSAASQRAANRSRRRGGAASRRRRGSRRRPRKPSRNQQR